MRHSHKIGLRNYGVLRGKVLEGRPDQARVDSPHYHIHVQAADQQFEVAVNVQSSHRPHELLFLVDTHFHHPLLTGLLQLPTGFTPLGRSSHSQVTGLDYIRAGLFRINQLRCLPANLPGPQNDLYDLITYYTRRAQSDPQSWFYVFGQRWGPNHRAVNTTFKFRPDNGIHNVHMNQGNSGRHVHENGVSQDGGLLFYFPIEQQWIAVFLAFQSQQWHTNQYTGQPLIQYSRRQHRRNLVSTRPIPEEASEDYILLIKKPTQAELGEAFEVAKD